jgi:hypothetical protein
MDRQPFVRGAARGVALWEWLDEFGDVAKEAKAVWSGQCASVQR